jgi:hypothetical protein
MRLEDALAIAKRTRVAQKQLLDGVLACQLLLQEHARNGHLQPAAAKVDTRMNGYIRMYPFIVVGTRCARGTGYPLCQGYRVPAVPGVPALHGYRHYMLLGTGPICYKRHGYCMLYWHK